MLIKTKKTILSLKTKKTNKTKKKVLFFTKKKFYRTGKKVLDGLLVLKQS